MTDYKNTLAQLNKNLAILREREAKYGGNAPLDLLNQITDHQTAITLTEQAISGELTEAEWREALKPLLVNIRDRTQAHPEWGVSIGDVQGGIINSIIAGRDVYHTEVHHHYPAEKPPPSPPTLNTAPPPPETFIPRPTEFNQLLQPLLNPAANRTLALTTALQGGGGFGKTTLAQALCHHEAVQKAYPLILWLDLGETPSLIELLNNQIRLLDAQALPFTDINAAAARLRDLLAGQPALIVLDDVWQESHATPFIQRSPTCVHLITTRRQDVANWLNAQAVNVSEMATAEAADLLASRLDERPMEMGPFRRLAAHLGEWPLLLTLAAAQLRELVVLDHLPLDEALTELWAALKEEGFTAFDRADEQQRNRAISRSLALSLERLGEWRGRYLELAVFPEDVDIPFAALERLWAGLTSHRVKTAIRAMHHLSLFSRYDAPGQTLRLHDVIRRYLMEQQADLPGLQRRFLDAYRPPSNSPQRGENLASPPLGGIEGGPPPPWAELPENEPYLWDRLFYHLSEARLTNELYSTATDLRYLAAKSYARSGAAVEADLWTAQKDFPDDTLLRTLSRHFTNAAHLLAKGETLQDVRLILYSRLHSIENVGPLCQSLISGLKPPYLFPSHALPDLPHPSLIRTLTGHTNLVLGCAYSPDGRFILSASSDHTLKVWDAQTGQEWLTLTGHRGSVNGCTYSPDGRFILSASVDGTLKVWDTQTGQERLILTGHRGSVNGCTYSPDGRFILSASADGTLKVWDAQTGQERLILTGHTRSVTDCAYSPDGRMILSASYDTTLKVWDAQTGQERLTLTGHRGNVNGCTYSPDGRMILSASYDTTLKVWDAQTGQEQLTLTGHRWWVTGCAYSPDGRTILSASHDKTLKVWDAQTGKERLALTGHTRSVDGCTYSPDGRFILSASGNGTLKVWDISALLDTRAQTGQERLTLTGHRGSVIGCAYSPDGRMILSASYDTTLKVWDTQTGQERLTLTGHTSFVNSCSYSPDGRMILSASDDKTLKVWDAQTGQELLTLTGHMEEVRGCAYSPDGRFILSASNDTTLKVWDAQTGQARLTLTGYTDWVTGCTYSPNGRTILSTSADGTLKVWDAQTGQERLTLTGYAQEVNGCAYSPDGRFILSAAENGTLKVWDAQTGQKRLTLTGHTEEVTGCSYNPDGRFILSVSSDDTLKVWDAQTGRCLTTLAVEGWLSDCAWSLDGTRVVAVGARGVYFFKVVT